MAQDVPDTDLGPYTAVVRAAVESAQAAARALDHAEVRPGHLLLGLVTRARGIAGAILNRLAVPLDTVRRDVEEQMGLGERPSPDHLPFSDDLHQVLTVALRETTGAGPNRLGTDHLLLGLLRQDGLAATVLQRRGAPLDEVIAARDHILAFTCYGCAEYGHQPEPFIGPEPSPQVHDIDRQITKIRRLKEEAIDAQDYEHAASVRDTEKDLLRRRMTLLGYDENELDLPTAIKEIARLREAADRLRDMLHHGHRGAHDHDTPHRP